MNGVRDQRQRIGGIAKNQLGNDERRVERSADRKRRAKTVRRVAVPGMTVGVTMRVGMIVQMMYRASFRGYSARNFEYYYSDTAISSSGMGPPPTGNTMNCLPPAM